MTLPDYGLSVAYSRGELSVSWSTAWVPADYVVRLLLSDAHGQPLPGAVVSYGADGASALVTGAAFTEGAALQVAIYAKSADSAAQSVTVRTLLAPAAPALDNRGGGILATWQAVAGAAAYQLRVLDAAGVPPSPQPAVACPYGGIVTNGWINGATLTDHTVYQIEMRSQATGSFSDWSAAARVTLDRSTPDSPLLRGLLARLKPAGAALALGPAILQASAVTDLFDRLLGFADGAVPLTAAEISSAADSVVIKAECTLFGVASIARFVFTDVDGALRLEMTAPLGARTVQQLYDTGVLPGSATPASTWANALAAFPAVTATFDSATATVRFTGPAASAPWGVLGLPGATLAAPMPNISVAAPSPAQPPEFQPRFSSTLTVGGKSIPIYLEVPVGMSGWRFGLDAAPPGLALGDLSALYALMGGATNLPDGVVSLGQFWITALDVVFSPGQASPTAWWFELGVAVGDPSGNSRPAWTIIDNLLAIDSLAATLSWTLYVPTGQSEPVASGRGSLFGTILVAGHPVKAVVTVPVGTDGWRLESAAAIPLTGLSDLSRYFGGDSSYLSGALAPLGAVQGFALSALGCRFHPPPTASLDEIRLALTVTNWTIPALPWFKASDIVFALDIMAPMDSAHRVLTAGLAATLAISDQLQVSLDGSYQSGTGIIDLAWSGQPLNAVPIGGLSSLVSGPQVKTNVPPELPVDGTFLLRTLAFSYDSHQSFLRTLDLELESLASWTVIPDVLVLHELKIELHVEKSDPAAAATTTGAVRAPVMLCGVWFDLAADKPSGADPWVLSASLTNSVDFQFSDVLSEMLGTSVTLPSGYGFPVGLTIVEAELTVTPSTRAFSFAGLALIDWSIGFGGASFAIKGLGGAVDFPGHDAPATGSVTGIFAFGLVTGTARVALGADDTHTVVTIAISNASAISPSAQVDAIAGTQTFASAAKPADLPIPSFASAGAVLDLTAESYLVHGQFGSGASGDLYGGLALLVQRSTGQPWQYAFAAGLRNWSFARLSAPLAVVDQVLSVSSTDAAIVLSSLGDDAAQAIAAYVPAIDADFKVKKGLNFYATLTFGDGLMSRVAALLNVSAKGPFTLSGFIPADAGESSFTATLGDLTLLGRLSFNKLVLTYTVAQGRTLTLAGDLAVAVPLLSGSAALSFAGAMVVNDTTATLMVDQTAQSVINPLGIPGVTISKLGLSLAYAFASTTVPASWSLEVHGATSIGPIALTGRVAFKDGTAALAAVAISQPVAIDAVFTQMIGAAWPAGLLAITFQSGSIWYAPTQVTLGGQDWAAGFNARTIVDIYFLTGVQLSVQLKPKTQTDAGGITAQAQYDHAIDWGFIKLYQNGANPAVGPAVWIGSASNGFTVRGGFALFGAAIADLTLNVSSQTMTGTATFQQDLGPFGKPTIDFTWNRAGFHVDNWPLDGLKLPDFDFDAIRGSGDCASIVASKLPIKSKFNLRPKLTVTATPRPALRIIIDGSFDLVANSAVYSGTILTTNIAQAILDVPLPASGSYDWDGLGMAFVECIQGAAQSIFKNLLEDPENLAKLLAVGGIEFAGKEVASYLICRGVPEAAAEAFADAASGAVATVVEVGGVGIAVGGVVGGIIGGIFHNGGSSDGGSSGGGGVSLPRPDTPAAPTLSWSNGALLAAWPAAANAASYVVVYSADGGRWINSNAVAGTSLTLAAPPGPLYAVKVVAAGAGGVSPPGQAASLQTIGAPAKLSASYVDSAAVVHWDAVHGADPASYQVAANHNGAPLSPAPKIAGASATGATLTSEAFDAGGDFIISVTASSAAMTGPPATTTLHIGVLPAPTGLGLSSGASTVLAQWTAVAGATGYRILVTDATGHLLSPQPNCQIDAGHCTAVISGAPLADGQTIAVKVAASAAAMAGTWCAPASLTVLWLAAPIFGLAYDEASHAITVSFVAIPRATAHQVQVLDHAGAPLQPDFLQSVIAPVATLDAARLAAGTIYTVRLRATASAAVGPWAAAPPINLAALDAPGAVTITNDSLSVTIDFHAVTGANAYEAEILIGAGQPLDPPLLVRGPAPPLVISAERLASGQSYTLRVRGLVTSG